ncbi:hypothetical protein Tsubulata_046189 [Turnera subulata]|uniref:Uncharacterized protein n=1 Tax=Turnera subulata TaxID=218843 RepID=A0A9Q0JMF6_9ROSI|nr:hypothetical protein Tsubulata_046189 [Turnera subulata]
MHGHGIRVCKLLFEDNFESKESKLTNALNKLSSVDTTNFKGYTVLLKQRIFLHCSRRHVWL